MGWDLSPLWNAAFGGHLPPYNKLMGRFESVLPKGCLKARIRYTKRESREAPSASLGAPLGDEASGYVIVDAAGAPMKYDMLSVMQDQ